MAAGPTHRLKLRDAKNRTAEVGVGWMNAETGAISVRLNPGTVLSWRDIEDSTLTFFPADDKPKSQSERRGPPLPPGYGLAPGE